MKLVKFILLSTALLVTALPVFSASPVDQWLANSEPKMDFGKDALEWKFAHPAPPVSHLPPIWQKGFDWLESKTNNSFKMRVFGGGSLYGFAGGFKAIRAGIADFGTCYTVAEAKGFELYKTLHLPYIAPVNPYLNARVINELMATTLKEEFTRRGVYPAHVMPLRPLTLMSKEPIKTPEDLRGKKLVSYLHAPGAAEALGFSEVHIPFPEIYTALQQGLIDAVVWVDMGFIPFKIYEQAKFYTAINISSATIETCMNRASFDGLNLPAKQLIYDLQQKIGIAVVEESEKFANNARSKLIENGVEIIELSDQQKVQWQKAFEPSVETWMKRCEEEGKDCRALVSDIKRLEKKYSGLSDEELMRLAIEEPVKGIIEF
tara:strand:- start:110 stop:1237 length:1128 start_codon:yes stop_codon:yes gene_type:complete